MRIYTGFVKSLKRIAFILAVLIGLSTIGISTIAAAEHEPISVINITSMPTKCNASGCLTDSNGNVVDKSSIVVNATDVNLYEIKSVGMSTIGASKYGYAVLTPKAGYVFATGNKSVSSKNFMIMVVLNSRIDNDSDLQFCHSYYGNTVAIGDVVVTWEVSEEGQAIETDKYKEDTTAKEEDTKYTGTTGNNEEASDTRADSGDNPSDVDSGYTANWLWISLATISILGILLFVNKKMLLERKKDEG